MGIVDKKTETGFWVQVRGLGLKTDPDIFKSTASLRFV